MLHDYWFVAWLDENDVRHRGDVARLLSRPEAIDSLLQAAPQPIIASRQRPSERLELLGGKGIDLTGDLTCHNPECVRTEVESLFRHAWHYFDDVIVPDQALTYVKRFEQDANRERLQRSLEWHAEILRYLREIGADDFISFEIRAPSCNEHWEHHARQAHIEHAIANVDSVAAALEPAAVVSWEVLEKDGHTHIKYRLDHHVFEHTVFRDICTSVYRFGSTRAENVRAILRHVVLDYLAELSADVLASRRMQAPLGATIQFYRSLLATHPSATVDDVAFELELPVINNVPLQVLLRLRKNERPHFERFQAALKDAVTARLATAGDANAEKIAADIRNDIIRPRVNEIRDKLRAARNVGLASSLPGLVFGGAMATVGLLGHLPQGYGPAVDVGGATLALQGSVRAVQDYLAARASVSLSDMYFLWKAEQHAHAA
ncbi:MAG TPA: hypothetical protein VGD01_15050 [Candidatus Elarobacter sp.]|jgi:hypothetical protein